MKNQYSVIVRADDQPIEGEGKIMLKEYRITDEGEIILHDKVEAAISMIQEYCPPEGYYVAFSGGKDSIVILDLVKRVGVKYDAHYNITTVDPPELVRFIKTFPEVERDRPAETMWQLIKRKQFLPLRQQRWCCEVLKESRGEGRFIITGIRRAESVKRSKRRVVEQCFKGTAKIFINLIINWTDKDVWDYIHLNRLRYCSLYDEGFKRLGCVCCPMGDQKRDAARWPKIAAAYKRAAIEAHNAAIAAGKKRSFNSGEEMYEWWISGKGNTDRPDQGVMFE